MYSDYDELKRRVTDAVVSRAARIPGIIVEIAADEVARRLRALRSDVSGAMDYIAGLPEHMRKQAAYDFFASFFSHYLPRKFLRRYIFGPPSPPSLILTKQEMVDCNPVIDVNACPAFLKTLQSFPRGKASGLSLSIRCPAAALTNGTLGQFTAKMAGALEYRAMDDWSFTGQMSFYDEWDFDPKDFKTGGRSFQGEIKTRFAHYLLPGSSFVIESEQVPFTQGSSDNSVQWTDKPPEFVPDNVAATDMRVKKD